tara:strand:- start:261 stop:428 length:168 start_codon:yes stop_codon:yes gene_type:complete
VDQVVEDHFTDQQVLVDLEDQEIHLLHLPHKVLMVEMGPDLEVDHQAVVEVELQQ